MRLHTMNAILEGEKKQDFTTRQHMFFLERSIEDLNKLAKSNNGFAFPLCGDTVQFIKEVSGL